MIKIGVFTITIINLFWHVFQSSVSSAIKQVGVKGGREWVPVCVRVWAQNVVYATIRGNRWERSSQNCGVGRG